MATVTWPAVLRPLGFASVGLRPGVAPAPRADRQSGREPGGAAAWHVSCRVLMRVHLRLPQLCLLRGPLSTGTGKCCATARLLCCHPHRHRNPADRGFPSSHWPPGSSEPSFRLALQGLMACPSCCAFAFSLSTHTQFSLVLSLLAV